MIAGFGPPLEPLQRILYASLERLAAECRKHPTPPTWREREVSAKLHATGDGVEGCAGDGHMVDCAQWKRGLRLELMLFRIHLLYPQHHIPRPAQRRRFRIERLSGRRFSLRRNALRARIPPDIIERWIRKQFPYAFNWGRDYCRWTKSESHTSFPFQRSSYAAQRCDVSYSHVSPHIMYISNACQVQPPLAFNEWRNEGGEPSEMPPSFRRDKRSLPYNTRHRRLRAQNWQGTDFPQ